MLWNTVKNDQKQVSKPMWDKRIPKVKAIKMKNFKLTEKIETPPPP